MGNITITGGEITAKGAGNGVNIGGTNVTVVIDGVAVNGKTYYTVRFVVDFSGQSVTTQNIVAGKKAKAPVIDIEGYRVSGWYTEAEYQNQFDFDTAITKSVTLYANLEDSTDYAVKVTIDGSTTKYTSFDAAWNDVQGKTATLMILTDQSFTSAVEMNNSDTNLTVEAADDNITNRSEGGFFKVV